MRLPATVLNLGYIELTRDDRDVVVRVYYDRNWLVDNPSRDPRLAALIDGTFINGGRGVCLELSNRGHRGMKVVIAGPQGTLAVPVAPGESMKASELAERGIRTRGDASDIWLV